mgnify:CR=1 FL=1|jgi:cell division septal protein FtsQ
MKSNSPEIAQQKAARAIRLILIVMVVLMLVPLLLVWLLGAFKLESAETITGSPIQSWDTRASVINRIFT